MSIEPNFKIKLYACIMSENEVGGGGGGRCGRDQTHTTTIKWGDIIIVLHANDV